MNSNLQSTKKKQLRNTRQLLKDMKLKLLIEKA